MTKDLVMALDALNPRCGCEHRGLLWFQFILLPNPIRLETEWLLTECLQCKACWIWGQQ